MSKKDKNKNKDKDNRHDKSSPLIPHKKVSLGDLALKDKILLKGDITGTIIQKDEHRLQITIPDDYVMVVYQVDNGPFAGGYGTFFKPKDETTRVALPKEDTYGTAVKKAASKLNPFSWSFFKPKDQKKDEASKGANTSEDEVED